MIIMRMEMIKNWRDLIPKVKRIEDVLKLMDDENLKSNRINIDAGYTTKTEVIKDGRAEYIDKPVIIYRLGLIRDIVFDVNPHWNEIKINNLSTDKQVRKFTNKDACGFLENVIKYMKDRAFHNLWDFALNYAKEIQK